MEGWLYLFNLDTGKATLICGETVTLFDANYEHIYYVTKQNPQTVVRVNLKGEEKTAYPMNGIITDMDYFGGIRGEPGIVENQADVVIYDLTENTRTVIFTYHDIEAVYLEYWEAGVFEMYICNDEHRYEVHWETGEIEEFPF